ncbi:hypothetical protein, variant [Aphanomyces invadans]|uniref:MORN repeat-containing protein 5 n=1 Tax=Aphanomyces invadans TaxID=157072 RepID=A0A024TY52_9STRA|nr:hypothetical protein, variant [Aphanomyces invadans]ETV98571.1 hypothetical protein, variant [Aphanomyces invadans]|eukprot:XP_008872768.1 hypothetical protein, variant [Aphanomyces invadans]
MIASMGTLALASCGVTDDRCGSFGTRDFATTRDRHEGMYHKDKRHGRGTYLWANGDKYMGEFYNGRMHGKGVLLSASTGDVFEGTWVKGVVAHGTKRFANGDTLQGTVSASTWNVDGTLTGEGVKTYRNGNEYRGRFDRGVQSGFGTFHWRSTGNVYAGMWVANTMDGYGRMEYMPSMPLADSGRCHVYVGTFAKGEFHGHGRIEYANGDVYEGAFERNVRHGRGVFRGRWDSYEGRWEDNHPQGVGCYIGDTVTYHGQWVGGWPQGRGMYTCRASGDRKRVQIHQGQCADDPNLTFNPLILLEYSIGDLFRIQRDVDEGIVGSFRGGAVSNVQL